LVAIQGVGVMVQQPVDGPPDLRAMFGQDGAPIGHRGCIPSTSIVAGEEASVTRARTCCSARRVALLDKPQWHRRVALLESRRCVPNGCLPRPHDPKTEDVVAVRGILVFADRGAAVDGVAGPTAAAKHAQVDGGQAHGVVYTQLLVVLAV